eukprot:gene19355-18952_t
MSRGSKGGPIVMQGLLVKRSQGKSGALGRTNWKDRWFTVDGLSLKYYAPAKNGRGPDKSLADDGLKGWIPLVDVSDCSEATPSDVGGKENCFGVTYVENSKAFTLYIQVKRASDLFGWIEAIAAGKKVAATATGSDVAGFSNEAEDVAGGKANPLFGGGGAGAAGGSDIEGRCVQCGKELPPKEDAAAEFGGFGDEAEFGGFGDEAAEPESKFCDSCKNE